MEDNPRKEGHIRYASDIEGGPSRRALSRHNSSDSLSRRSSLSARRTVDPDIILPAEYRTLYVVKTKLFIIDSNDTRSFAVDEVRARDADKETDQKPQTADKLDATAARELSSSHCAFRTNLHLSRGRRFAVA